VKLIDTSAWVHQLRRSGDPQVQARVEHLLRAGAAAWCPMVRLELWANAAGSHERRVLRDYEATIPELAITDEIWQGACELADRCRKTGKTAPSTDVLIAACARHHGVEIEHADAHFDFLMAL
jgi:predicted nucleic acid-binding protein